MRPSLFLMLSSCALFTACNKKEGDSGGIPTDTNSCPAPENDQDGDCWAPPDDCDDTDPYAYPGADEVPYDGIDNDCDGEDVVDADGDGYIGEAAGGDDCNDNNPEYYPGAEETCQDKYAGYDVDCDGSEQTDDCDGDGSDRWDDCNDDNPDSYPGAEEIWYDGIDGDCDTESDYDQDGDGQEHADYGGEDCDDTRADVYYAAAEIWDGVDHDCDGYADMMAQADAQVEYMGSNYDHADYYMGWVVDWMSDMNGDGTPDIATAGPNNGYNLLDKSTVPTGRVYIVPGSGPTGHSSYFTESAIAYVDGGSEEYLGFDMVVPGDMDGDGYDELLVAAPYHYQSSMYGASLLYSGADLLAYGALGTADATATLFGGDYWGFDCTAIPDLDGDGVPELTAGANDYIAPSFGIWSGASAMAGGSLDVGEAMVEFGLFSGNAMGGDICPGGDFNGDGLQELLVGYGSHTWEDDGAGGSVRTGADGTLVVIPGDDLAQGGSFTGNSGSQVTDSDGTGIGWRHGWTYDADGDGYDELLAGAFYASGDYEQAGTVYVIPGQSTLLDGSAPNMASLTIHGALDYGWLIPSKEPADFDANGRGDILVSHIGSMVGDIKGHSYVFRDSAITAGGTVLADESAEIFATKYEDDRFGFSSAFTDLDDDGDDDVLISAYFPLDGKLWAYYSEVPRD